MYNGAISLVNNLVNNTGVGSTSDLKEGKGKSNISGYISANASIGLEGNLSNYYEYSESTKGYKELHLIYGAAHAMSREILGEKIYTNIVREFLGNINK